MKFEIENLKQVGVVNVHFNMKTPKIVCGYV